MRGQRRDLVDGRAAEAVGREHLERRVEDAFLVFFLDAGALARLARAGGVRRAHRCAAGGPGKSGNVTVCKLSASRPVQAR